MDYGDIICDSNGLVWIINSIAILAFIFGPKQKLQIEEKKEPFSLRMFDWPRCS